MQHNASTQPNNMYNSQGMSTFNMPPPPHIYPSPLQGTPPPQPPQSSQQSSKPLPLMSINPFGNSSPPHNPHNNGQQQQQQQMNNNNNNNNYPPPPPMPQQMFPFNMNQPPPAFNQNLLQTPNSQLLNNNMMQFRQNSPGIPFPDLSKPPPGFGAPPPPLQHYNPMPLMQHDIPSPPKPLMSIPEKKLPEIPYFSLPAGLMLPLIKVDACIRLS